MCPVLLTKTLHMILHGMSANTMSLSANHRMLGAVASPNLYIFCLPPKPLHQPLYSGVLLIQRMSDNGHIPARQLGRGVAYCDQYRSRKSVAAF